MGLVHEFCVAAMVARGSTGESTHECRRPVKEVCALKRPERAAGDPLRCCRGCRCHEPRATTRRDTIIDIAARHGARNVRVFGSVARGDDRPASDLDLLVDMESDRSLLDLVGLAQDLEALLNRNVDIVTGASLHDAIREQVLAESRPL